MAKEIVNSGEDKTAEVQSEAKAHPRQTPPKPYTDADTEDHFRVLAANFKKNAGKPMH